MSRRQILAAALACVLGLTASAAWAGPGPGGGNKAGKVEGTLSHVDLVNNLVSVTTQGGVVVTVKVVVTTKVERNGVRVPLSALVVGERGQALFDPATRIATKVESRTVAAAAPGRGGGNKAGKVEGTVSAVDVAGGLVSITTRGGTVVTVKVVATTKVERNDARTTIASFKIGDRGQALFDPATLIATKVEAVGP